MMTLQHAINKIIEHDRQAAHVAVVVERLRDHKILYAKDGHQLFMPASTQKLLTAVAAYQYLKPSYRFDTNAYEAHADLYIKFSGDPTFKTNYLRAMIDKLKQKGASHFRHVYVDNSDFDFVPYAPGWIWDDMAYAYAAPLNAVIINQNKFYLVLKPHKKRIRLTTKLPAGLVHFNNQILATHQSVKHCPLRIYATSPGYYHLAGCVNAKHRRQVRELAITDPVAYAKRLIRLDLRADNIKYRGNIRLKKTPGQAKLLATHQSKTLTKIIHHMLKASDNLYADALLKKIGERYDHAPGSWQNGVRSLKIILAPTKINFKKNLIDDGAGGSRYNLLQPNQLLKLLVYVNAHHKLRHWLWHDLPIAGKDGTLEWRFKHHAHHLIRAKTGNMTGVSNLAGFIDSKHQGELAFVIMVNGFVNRREHHAIWKMQDKLCLLAGGS